MSSFKNLLLFGYIVGLRVSKSEVRRDRTTEQLKPSY